MAQSDARPSRRRPRRRPYRRFILTSLALCAATGGLLYRFTPLPWMLIYLVALSACAFALCGYDKRIAGGTTMRVPENVLFGLAFLGGTPGLLLGMNVFRHKTKKARFQWIFGGVMVAQIALAYGAWVALT